MISGEIDLTRNSSSQRFRGEAASKMSCRQGRRRDQSIEKSLQIQAAAHLKIHGAAFRVPIGASGKTAHAVTPFAMCDIQVLVIPFDGSGQVAHFVVAPFQSIAAQRRLYARLLDFCDVSAEFNCSEGSAAGKLNFCSSFTTRFAINNRLCHSSAGTRRRRLIILALD